MDTLVIQSKPESHDGKHITIRVSYLESTYQETENVQDFTFEMFFSSLGGFIGIFLGYSMLQIPELLNNIPSCARKLKTSAGKVIFIKKKKSMIDNIYKFLFLSFHFVIIFF